jgi:DNA-directed RNA polymerase specialized sigma24 family protein
MGGTDRPVGEGGHSHRSAATPTDRARKSLSEKYYQPLLQLAALLTGDAVVAEAVVGGAFAAIPAAALAGWSTEDCLRYLQRLVLIRCRRAARFRRQSAAGGRHAVSDFARLPVVAALRGLPRTAREAIVLTHYLDLPAAQAAALAGVSEALLTASLATAMRAIDDQLIGLFPDS